MSQGRDEFAKKRTLDEVDGDDAGRKGTKRPLLTLGNTETAPPIQETGTQETTVTGSYLLSTLKEPPREVLANQTGPDHGNGDTGH